MYICVPFSGAPLIGSVGQCATEGECAIGCVETQSVSACARACREGRLVHIHTQTRTQIYGCSVAGTTVFFPRSFSPVFPLYTVASELRGKRGREAAMVTDHCGSEWRGPDGYLAAAPQSHWLHTRVSVNECVLSVCVLTRRHAEWGSVWTCV